MNSINTGTNFGGSSCTLYDRIEREHVSVIFSKEHQGPVARITQDTDPRVMRVLLPNINCKGEIVLRNGGQNLKKKLRSLIHVDKDGYIVPPVSPLDSS